MNSKSPYILVADDDQDDQELFAERFIRLNPDAKVESVDNGFEALAFLRGCPPGDLPHAILVDYKMPVLTGYDFLVAVKEDSRYQHIPKIIWSTSSNQEYVIKCREAGADRYLTKPNDIRGFDRVVGEITHLFRENDRARGCG